MLAALIEKKTISKMALQGKVCLVTGATRGIGKGIAVQLGLAGATVYATGRTLKKNPNTYGSSLEEVAQQIDKEGGKCVPVQCDHTNDDQVKEVFERIKQEQNGRLDVLVNNAYSGGEAIMRLKGTPFYEADPTLWDDMNNVGLRNHYICTVYGARMMVQRQTGLIVTVSSAAGLQYFFNVPYGIGKEACDRMMADCAVELKRNNVACISLWPGPVFTEFNQEILKTKEDEEHKIAMESAESPDFSGMCIAKLATDPKIMKKSGRIFMTCDLGDEYNIKDLNGQKVASMRSPSHLLKLLGWRKTSALIPGFIKIPTPAMHVAGYKF